MTLTQLVKICLSFYGTYSLIIIFTRSSPEVLFNISYHADFIQSVVNFLPNPQAGGSPLVSCLKLLIKYIHSYPPYLEVVSSIWNLKTLAMMTGDPLLDQLL